MYVIGILFQHLNHTSNHFNRREPTQSVDTIVRDRQIRQHLNHISSHFKRREPTQNLQSLALNFDTNIRDR